MFKIWIISLSRKIPKFSTTLHVYHENDVQKSDVVFFIKKGFKNENKPPAIIQMRKESLVSSSVIKIEQKNSFRSCLSSHTAARKVWSSPLAGSGTWWKSFIFKLFMSQILTNWDWTPFAIKTQMADHRSIEHSTKGEINVISRLWVVREMIMLKTSFSFCIRRTWSVDPRAITTGS